MPIHHVIFFALNQFFVWYSILHYNEAFLKAAPSIWTKTSISLKWLSYLWQEGDFGAFVIFSHIEWSSSAAYSTVENSPQSFWSWSQNYSCFTSKLLNHNSEPWFCKLTLKIQALLAEALGKHQAGWDGKGRVHTLFSVYAAFITLGVAMWRCIPSFAALVMMEWRTLFPSPIQAMVSPFRPP